jgi:addiction module HigA family antidote
MPPIHPGEVLVDSLAEAGIPPSALADALDLAPNELSDILAGHRPITSDAALRLARYFNTSSQLWLNLQAQFEVALTA